MELWRLLAHRHWFTFRLFGSEVRLCARCSGYIVGLSTLAALGTFLGLTFFRTIPIQYQIFMCLLLATPLAFDWVTHSRGLRASNNYLRFVTGAILGVGVYLFSLIDVTLNMKTTIYALTASAIFLAGLLRLRPHTSTM